MSNHAILCPDSLTISVVDIVVTSIEVTPGSLSLQGQGEGEVSISWTRQEVWVIDLRILDSFVE